MSQSQLVRACDSYTGARHRSPPRNVLHVVHLVTALNVGGLEQVVIDLVRRTDRSRFRCTVVCIQERGVYAPQVESLGIPVISLDGAMRSLRASFPRLLRTLFRLRPDVLHTHNPHPHWLGALAGSILRIPKVVHTKHGRNKPERRGMVIANRIAAMFSSVVVAVSADSANVATEIERVSRRKVKLIHNGIDLEKFAFEDRTARTGPLRAIHVARLNIIKDQKTLLDAVRLVVDRVPEFHLTIAGDGPLREELHAHRDKLGLERHVEFLGDRRDIPELLAQADFFILSSLKEGLSITLLEAMASGLPVVATDVGGNRELVKPGETGLLVPSRSPEKLAAAILELLPRPELVRTLGRTARRLVEQSFSLEMAVREYEYLYGRTRE